ncbi:MAG: protein kinase, partial [Planctomycetota bacterium]|nr:protein kinase [Planctomycetota bacterium]
MPFAPRAITAVLPADLLTLIDPALPFQDLTQERGLEPAPRVQVGDKVVPAVGGMPLFMKLGHGRMGAVYYGVSPASKSSVAVKIVPVAVANKDLVQRFHREVRIASTIRSPHLVTIRGLGEQNSLYYVVTDFVPGTSAGLYLQDARKAGKVGLPEALALDLCIAAVTGLVEAHKNGIIHGDVRPENILIPRDKQTGQLSYNDALLADLGLPRVEELGGILKDSSAAMGTPGFMS